MKYQICVVKDGAKRFGVLFVNGIPTKEMWTGDAEGWKNISEGYKNGTVEEFVTNRNFCHMRQTDSGNNVNSMLRSLERNKDAPIEGYNPKTDTITIHT
jgi:hypothetical protein